MRRCWVIVVCASLQDPPAARRADLISTATAIEVEDSEHYVTYIDAYTGDVVERAYPFVH